MMYKDEDKQREANRKAQAKFKAKGITQGITKQGITDKVLPIGLTDRGGTCEGFTIPKRGKDIKCFADLPPDVQATINRLSDSNEEKAKRTAIAINYQHLFPDRYHSIGVTL